ncbi:MAG: hypothetical protein EAZ91_16255 [Cytophagales bacterium]|nr:MAG: hypothetical protein EAZ91_16255 [Cytophagales bacterium]
MTQPYATSNPCLRCGQSFRCRVDNIQSCDCARVTLSPDELVAIRQYTERTFGAYTCLCAGCLNELRTESRVPTA